MTQSPGWSGEGSEWRSTRSLPDLSSTFLRTFSGFSAYNCWCTHWSHKWGFLEAKFNFTLRHLSPWNPKWISSLAFQPSWHPTSLTTYDLAVLTATRHSYCFCSLLQPQGSLVRRCRSWKGLLTPPKNGITGVWVTCSICPSFSSSYTDLRFYFALVNFLPWEISGRGLSSFYMAPQNLGTRDQLSKDSSPWFWWFWWEYWNDTWVLQLNMHMAGTWDAKILL